MDNIRPVGKCAFYRAMLLIWAGAISIYASNYHVAKTGSDLNSGTPGAPYLTINKAAAIARPGDSVIIHAGEYREQVQPLNGGTGENARITYCNAPGEKAIIKGSERITTWVSQDSGIWKVDLDNSFFKGFNPFTTTVNCGIWMTYGQWHHCGDVFLNGGKLIEWKLPGDVRAHQNSWCTGTSGSTTSIWANFGAINPNTALTEINVREMCFAPQNVGTSYITVSGLTFMQAATPWGGPDCGDQVGAVCTKTGSHWIIENCLVSDARCCGISIGRWTGGVETINSGHHIIRNNVIRHCGQAGIVGCQFNIGSLIMGNLVENINNYIPGYEWTHEFGGWEDAGIKLHFAVDVTIKNNLIREVGDAGAGYGIWMDWSWQNARVTGNVFVMNSEPGGERPQVYIEEGFGPHLIDNNVFIGGGVEQLSSQAAVCVHNLFYNCSYNAWKTDNARQPIYFLPHTVTNAGTGVSSPSMDRWYNNIFIKQGLWNATVPDFKVDYNVYLQGAAKSQASQFDVNSIVNSYNPGFSYKSDSSGVSVSLSMNNLPWNVLTPLITTAYIGPIASCGRGPENADGSPLTVDKDFFGNPRNTTHPLPGPFENMAQGTNNFKVFTISNGAASTQSGNPVFAARRVFPNAMRITRHRREVLIQVAATNVSDNAQVKIFTIGGRLVRLFKLGGADSGRIVWDGKDFRGGRVKQGMYLVEYSNKDIAAKAETRELVIQN
ncbi:MAG: right-handed parallel beta-helix repeat-containing protein [Chitinivibrionales bacterium]|nr:right-handed parallel beta-helix repeat-containing protein [Chitinivibrionales bacterium]